MMLHVTWGVHGKEFCKTVVWPSIPMWKFESPIVDLEVLQTKIVNNQVDLVSEFNRHVNQKYITFKQVFTDGSKDPITGVTGAVIVVPSQMSKMSRRTSENIAVELFAILMALEWIECTKSNRTLICSDSVSVLQSLKTGMVKNHQELLYDVMSIYSRIKNKGDEVIFMWVPPHMGIIGNEKVDKIAKKALQKRV